jgi:hypothetical protein
MSGPAGVMALVLAETAAGGAWFLFLTPLWREVRPGFFYLTGAIVLVLAAGAAGAAQAARHPGVGTDGRLHVWLAWSLAGATAVWLALMLRRLRTAARGLGLLTVPLAVVMLFAFARTADESVGLSFFQLVAGAAFTGAVLDGLLLGHWYLTERKLPRRPINRMAWLLIGSVAVETAAVIAGWGSGSSTQAGENSLNPLLSISSSASLIAVGMVACTGLIAVFIRLSLKGTRPQAVQSATGFFYLAVITAFTAELAAKIRFLP